MEDVFELSKFDEYKEDRKEKIETNNCHFTRSFKEFLWSYTYLNVHQAAMKHNALRGLKKV